MGTLWTSIQLDLVQMNALIHISIIYSTNGHHQYTNKCKKLKEGSIDFQTHLKDQGKTQHQTQLQWS